MTKKHLLQSGSAILIVTIVTTIVIAGGLGYVWWQNSHKRGVQTDTQTTSTQKETKSTEDINKKASQQEEYLVIKEWGVKLKTSLADHLVYQPQSSTNTGSPMPYDELGLSFKPTSVIDQHCVKFGIDLYRQLGPSDRYQTKKIGDYYYYVTGGPGICSDEPSDIQLQQTALNELNLSNLEKIED